MLSYSTKEAIKIGLALALTFLATISLGWGKSSWAILTVVVISAVETYGYAALKSQNRLYGTVIGAVVGMFFIATIGQERILMIAALTAFLAFCVYMFSDERRGYMWNIAITVVVIVCSSSFANSGQIFDTAVLRLQETALGIFVYSMVYRFLWPNTAESSFKKTKMLIHENLNKALDSFEDDAKNNGLVRNDGLYFANQKAIYALKDLLTIPVFTDGFEYVHQKKKWTTIANAYEQAQFAVDKILNNQNITTDNADLKNLRHIMSNVNAVIENEDEAAYAELKALPVAKPLPAFYRNYGMRLRNAVNSIFSLLACFLMWIYLPVPGGVIFMVIAGILVSNLTVIPGPIIKLAMVCYTFFTILLLAQVVLIFPTFTEAWQMASALFLNAFIIWKIFDKLNLGPLKLLAGNAIANMTGGATGMVPNYDVLGPITSLCYLVIILMVLNFFTGVFAKTFMNVQPPKKYLQAE
jgi:uncharacterized membrane protein YccC